MDTYAVYDKATGLLVSTGTVVAADLPSNLAVKKFTTDTGSPDFAAEQWNPGTKKFEKRPPDAAEVARQERIAQVRSLHGKSNRTPAETDALVDTLIALLPRDVAAALT